ncbi:MAG: hypothetical protein WBC70_04315 [Candidatus Aminicenantales bacterium]
MRILDKGAVIMQEREEERTGTPKPAESKNNPQPPCECDPDCCGWSSRRGRNESYYRVC